MDLRKEELDKTSAANFTIFEAARQRKVLPVLIIGLIDVLLGTTMLIMGLVAALAFGQGHHNFSDGGPAYYTGCFTGFLFFFLKGLVFCYLYIKTSSDHTKNTSSLGLTKTAYVLTIACLVGFIVSIVPTVVSGVFSSESDVIHYNIAIVTVVLLSVCLINDIYASVFVWLTFNLSSKWRKKETGSSPKIQNPLPVQKIQKTATFEPGKTCPCCQANKQNNALQSNCN